uniref:Uncharacterized protein n=1 Tax=Plectus sambesii TaxID=2011161 RepID=A0A914XN61_9BILA
MTLLSSCQLGLDEESGITQLSRSSMQPSTLTNDIAGASTQTDREEKLNEQVASASGCDADRSDVRAGGRVSTVGWPGGSSHALEQRGTLAGSLFVHDATHRNVPISSVDIGASRTPQIVHGT